MPLLEKKISPSKKAAHKNNQIEGGCDVAEGMLFVEDLIAF
jgi:hypothetical protein